MRASLLGNGSVPGTDAAGISIVGKGFLLLTTRGQI
jgi:hypothetical protein